MAALVAAWYARPVGAAVPKPEIDLQVTKTVSAAEIDPGGSLTYAVEVRNAGPSGALAVVVDDVLPGGVTVDSFAATRGTCAEAAGVVRCDIGAMAAGDLVTLTMVVTVAPDATGQLLNACVVRNEEDPQFAPKDVDPTNDTCEASTVVTTTTTTTSTSTTTTSTTTTTTTTTAPPAAPARLEVALVDETDDGREPDSVARGESYRYVFYLVNAGGEAAAVDGVRITIPAARFVEATGGVRFSPLSPRDEQTAPPRCSLTGVVADCSSFSVPPGGVRLEVAVQAVAAAPVTVVASATAFAAGRELSDDEPTTLTGARPADLVLGAASATELVLAVGDEAALALLLENASGETVGPVEVAVTVPAGLTMLAGPSTWRVPALTPGGSAALELVIRADDAGRSTVVAEVVAVAGEAPVVQGEGVGPGRVEFDVAVTDILGTELRSARGVVFRDDDADGVRDAGEGGIAGIAVQLVDPGGTAVAAALSDRSGRYLLAGARPGQRVEVMAAGFILTTPGSRLVGDEPIDFGLLVVEAIPDTGFAGGRAAAGGVALLSFGAFLLLVAPRPRRVRRDR